MQSSRFLTQRKSDALVEGVKQLASRRQRALLDKRVHVEGRIKMQNESVFGSVDRIQEAIALKRRISFVYFKYDAAKRKALQHNGERYIETPVQLVYAEGYYYLVVFNEKHDDFANYRVDRMDRIEVLDEPALKNERIATFDARELESRAFGMYSGEPVAATLLVDEEVMGRGHRPVRQGRGVGADGGEAGARVRDGDEEPRAVRVAGSVRRPRSHREADRAGAGVPRLP